MKKDLQVMRTDEMHSSLWISHDMRCLSFNPADDFEWVQYKTDSEMFQHAINLVEQLYFVM